MSWLLPTRASQAEPSLAKQQYSRTHTHTLQTSEEEDRPSLDDDDGQVDAARMVAIVRLEGKREVRLCVFICVCRACCSAGFFQCCV